VKASSSTTKGRLVSSQSSIIHSDVLRLFRKQSYHRLGTATDLRFGAQVLLVGMVAVHATPHHTLTDTNADADLHPSGLIFASAPAINTIAVINPKLNPNTDSAHS
jgi:hypothetical protein